MSSILDALKKLEQESVQTEDIVEHHLDEETAERELVGRSRLTIRLSPAVLIGGSIIAVTGVISLSVVISLLILNNSQQPVATATKTALTPSATVVAQAEVVPPQAQADQSPQPVEEPAPTAPATAMNVAKQVTPPEFATAPPVVVEVVPDPPVVRETLSPAVSPSTTTPDPVVQPAAPPVDERENAVDTVSAPDNIPAEPASEMVHIAQAAPDPPREQPPLIRAPVDDRAAPAPTAPPRSETRRLPTDLSELPPLGETVRQRFGLSDLVLNMPRPANRYQPQASAVINMTRVLEGERIPGTKARLVGVDVRGIAIQMIDSGEQFYLRF